MKEYTIKEFVEGYEKCVTDLLKERYITERLVLRTEYVSFLEKVELCKNLVNHFCMSENGNYINMNTPLKFLFYTKTLITKYTNLVSESAGFWDEYDLLKKSKILDIIMDTIPEIERYDFKSILDMVEEDCMTNHYEIHSFIDRQSVRFKELLENILNPIADELSNILNNMNEIDDKSLVDKIKMILKLK